MRLAIIEKRPDFCRTLGNFVKITTSTVCYSFGFEEQFKDEGAFLGEEVL